MYQRKFAEALALLQKFPGETFHDQTGMASPKALLEGICYFFLGDIGKARQASESARAFTEAQLRETPEKAGLHAQLGTIFALLNRKADAIREGKRATELLPETRDAFDGGATTIALAQIYAWTGENDQALQLIEHSLQTPAGITVPLLKIDPAWDCLRKDPAFQQMLAKHEGKSG